MPSRTPPRQRIVIAGASGGRGLPAALAFAGSARGALLLARGGAGS
jgi:NAD(P)-dependent dehydrogenase (short-subunit alcohol dehydrogenase family)